MGWRPAATAPVEPGHRKVDQQKAAESAAMNSMPYATAMTVKTPGGDANTATQSWTRRPGGGTGGNKTSGPATL
ncbi:hypothetical protein NDU88_006985 [Pleurodeles waltl]|uniref:Uncharacterized protein n=1 Tax=Pleurodeles waltl TaxID=8319 RepID=A0AAV7QMQ9_PLEWA|nr:hypothetical protein NDU88_006985 [Pleurodeles waltl]